MKSLHSKLKELNAVKRHKLHQLIHHIHKRHHISKKTLFYVKEYGPHSNVSRVIIKESLKILILASIVSSLGGFALEEIKTVFIAITPLVILLPALNDMIGDYGSIIASRFSTMLHTGKAKGNLWLNKELHKMFLQVMVIALFTAAASALIALTVSKFSNFALTEEIMLKVFLITVLDAALLVTVLTFISIFAGLYYFKKQEDPNNFLIPIATSVADFGNMVLLALLVVWFF